MRRPGCIAAATHARIACWLLLYLQCCTAAVLKTVMDNALVLQPYNSSSFSGAELANDLLAFISEGGSGSNITTAIIPAGNYLVTPDTSKGSQYHINLYCDKRSGNNQTLELAMDGVSFSFTSASFGGISLSNCSFINWHGLTLRYNLSVLPFTQGTVLAVSENSTATKFTVQIHAGFPTSAAIKPGPAALFRGFERATRLPKTSGDWLQNDIRTGAVALNKNGSFTYTYKGGHGSLGFSPGDFIAVTRPNGNHAVSLFATEGIAFANWSIYQGYGFGINDGGSVGAPNSYTNVSIVPDPVPIGADGQTALLSVNSDGLHSTGAQTGPQITNSTIALTGDDAIAVHGYFGVVGGADVTARVVTLLELDGGTSNLGLPAVGDRLWLYDPNATYLGESRVTSVRLLAKNPLPKGTKSAIFYNSSPASVPAWNITLDPWLATFTVQSLGMDAFWSTPDRSGSYYSVTRSTVSWVHSRGIIAKGSYAYIAENNIIGASVAGIVLQPESYWDQAGYSANVSIVNNTIQQVAWSYGSLAGCYIGPLGSNLALNNHNIDIVGNVFVNVSTTNVQVEAAEDVIVAYNTFVDPFAFYSPRSTAAGNGNFSVIWADGAAGVEVFGNVIVDSGCSNCTYNRQKPFNASSLVTGLYLGNDTGFETPAGAAS